MRSQQRPASGPDSVRVLYRGRLPGLGTGSVTTWLQGVTPSHRAYLTHHLAEPDRFAVEMVELSAQTSALQVAGLSRRLGRGVSPTVGKLRGESLAAFADLVDQTGPFITRARDYAGPHVAASHEHIAYELSPDLLMLADRDGTHSRRLGPNLAAAYYPVFSHDGEHIAYTGCTPRMPVPQGAFSRCRYSVFVGALENQIEAREVISPQPPVFSPDGTSVYAASHDNDHGHRAVRPWWVRVPCGRRDRRGDQARVLDEHHPGGVSSGRRRQDGHLLRAHARPRARGPRARPPERCRAPRGHRSTRNDGRRGRERRRPRARRSSRHRRGRSSDGSAARPPQARSSQLRASVESVARRPPPSTPWSTTRARFASSKSTRATSRMNRAVVWIVPSVTRSTHSRVKTAVLSSAVSLHEPRAERGSSCRNTRCSLSQRWRSHVAEQRGVK